MCSVNVIA